MIQSDYTILSDSPANYSLNKLLEKCFVCTLVLGILCNLINIIVYSKKTMQLHLSFRLMLAMSIVDVCILTLCSLETLSDIYLQVRLRTTSRLLCKTNTFLIYSLTQMRVVLSVAVVVQRAIVLSTLNVTHVRNDSLFQSSSVAKSTISVIKLTNTNIVPSYNSFTMIANRDVKKLATILVAQQQSEPQIKLDPLTLNARYQKNHKNSFLQVKSSHQLRRNSTGSFREHIFNRKTSLSHNNLLLLFEQNSLCQKSTNLLDETKNNAMDTKMKNIPRRKTLLTTYEINRCKSVG
jgi:hypothetical protein